jgi:hypothetical protein
LWANLHGAFFIGPLLLLLLAGFRILARRLLPASPNARTDHDTAVPGRACTPLPPARVLLLSAVLMVLGSFINPYGPRLWEFIFQSAGKVRPYLSEWAMFHPVRHFYSHVDFMVLALVSVAAVCFTRRRRDPVRLAVLATALVAAVSMRRNIPLFAITAGFIVPAHLYSVAGRSVSRLHAAAPRPALAAALAAFALLNLVSAARFNKTDPLAFEVPSHKYAVRAIEFMDEHDIGGNALVFFDWAEYCIWHRYPDTRVFLDGRFRSAYSTEVIDTYFRFLYRAEGWQRALERYPTDIVLLHRGNPVYTAMQTRDGWHEVLVTDTTALFLKEAAHAETLRRLGQPPILRPDGARAYFP